MAYDFSSLKILVIEGSNEMFTLTRSVLQAFGVGEVIHANDAKAGLRKFGATRPDIVITDWLDGQNDGVWVTEEMRQSPQSSDHFVPIIMMTGFSQKKRVIRARDAGINEFLVKPFSAKTLYRKIENVIEQPREFIRSSDFFGPCRRRHDAEYDGPEHGMNPDEKKEQRSALLQTAEGIRDKGRAAAAKGGKKK